MDERVVLQLLIVGLVKVVSGALVHVAATAVVNVVGLAHSLCLLSFSAGNWSFWYRPFGNVGAVCRPRIDFTAIFVDLIRVFLVEAAALCGRDSGVRWTSAWTGPDDEAYRRKIPSPKFSKFWWFALAWVSQHPSLTMLARFKVAVALDAAISQNTPFAESFAVTCAWPVWICMTYFRK